MAHIRQLIFSLTALLLLSACTIVDTGGAIDNVGREVPICAETPASRGHKAAATPILSTPDGKRYVELKVHYVPAQTDWFRCCMVGGCPVYQNPPGIPHDNTETSIWYAELSDTAPLQATRLIPAAELDLSHATPTRPRLTTGAQQRLIRANMPERRNALNTAMQPVRWVAEVADIPLSIVATPVNWLVMLTGHNIWKY